MVFQYDSQPSPRKKWTRYILIAALIIGASLLGYRTYRSLVTQTSTTFNPATSDPVSEQLRKESIDDLQAISNDLEQIDVETIEQ